MHVMPSMPFPSLEASSPFQEWIPPGEYCPVSIGVRLLGDRWSLLIVRELLVRNTRFNEIIRALPGLSRGLLSGRLRYLQQVGVVAHRPGSLDYVLTEQGHALRPVLESLGAWSLRWQLPGESETAPNVSLILWRSYQSIERSLLPDGLITIHYRFTDSPANSGWLYVGRKGGGTCIGPSDRTPDLTVTTASTTLNDLWWGRRTCQSAIASKEIAFEGPTHLARAFPTWFPHRPAITATAATG